MKIREFEQKIGYQFQNRDYLETALTHSSFNREKNTKHQDNERLEFLGDAFFDAVISVELFARMQHVTEGKLTKTRALIVCESTLAKIARGYDLGSYLKLGHGEDTGGGRHKDSILADSMEAVIGAMYLDGAMEEARRLIETVVPIADVPRVHDYKTKYQELCQRVTGEAPVYRITGEDGPAHDRMFYAQVLLNDKVMGEGAGGSKKHAEQQAARDALSKQGL